MRDKVIPAVAGASVMALVTVGGGIFAFGQKLGSAEATAIYWQRYHQAMVSLPAGCRPTEGAP